MKTCIYLIFSLYAICIQAQDIYNNLNQKFTQYLIKTLPENIYVQTDKPYYVVEDTIWTKAFVVNAQLLQPSPSNFVYVELINQQNEVLNRIKAKKRFCRISRIYQIKRAHPRRRVCTPCLYKLDEKRSAGILLPKKYYY